MFGFSAAFEMLILLFFTRVVVVVVGDVVCAAAVDGCFTACFWSSCCSCCSLLFFLNLYLCFGCIYQKLPHCNFSELSIMYPIVSFFEVKGRSVFSDILSCYDIFLF